MGLTFVEATVTGKKGKKATVKFLVDSGAIYSLLPEKDWKAIGLKPKHSMTFTLADGTEIKRDVSECHIAMNQVDGHTPVILGEPGDDPLLGAVTLEVLGLVLNPFNRTLQSLHGVLA
jgi:clan AA aspartic protease